MQVIFYDLDKRINSTTTPTEEGVTLNCRLKEPTSITEPVLLVDGPPMITYNYALIDRFDRYYYIKDVVSIGNNLTEYHLKVDVLASFQSYINAVNTHIAYAAENWDPLIADTRMAIKTTKQQHGMAIPMESDQSNTDVFDQTGCYIFTCLNNFYDNTGVAGFANAYMFDNENMGKISEWVCDTSVMASLVQYFNGPILSGALGCIWVPFPYGKGPCSSTNKIHFGDISSADPIHPSPQTIEGYKFNAWPVLNTTYKAEISYRYPENDFRAFPPYTTATLYLPGVGNIDINKSDFIKPGSISDPNNKSHITVTVSLEYITGNVTYLIWNDWGALVQTATCNVAANCPLGQTTINQSASNSILSTFASPVTSIAAGVVGFATGNPVMGALGIGNALSGAANAAIQFNRHSSSISGSTGGKSSAILPSIFYTEYSVDTEDIGTNDGQLYDYIVKQGRPVGKMGILRDYHGFVQCEGATIKANCTDWERREINNYLNSGFYNDHEE